MRFHLLLMKLRAAQLRGISGILQSQPVLRSLSFGGFSAPSSPQQAVEYSATENKNGFKHGTCNIYLRDATIAK